MDNANSQQEKAMSHYRFGMVSAFDMLCGNATYAQSLLAGLSKQVDTVKIHLPTTIRKFRDIAAEKAILQQVVQCDFINIQMELGLFGANPKHSVRLIKKIIKLSKQVSLTMHRVEEKPLDIMRGLYQNMRLSSIVSTYLYRKHKELIVYAHHKGATFLVHTHREKARIRRIVPNAVVSVHPIVWPDNYCHDDPSFRPYAIKTLFRNNRLPIIGLFGFMSDYKNFLQVVRVALRDRSFNILLAGGTHPEAQHYGQGLAHIEGDRALETTKIAHLLISDGYDRVASVHSPGDAELLYLMKNVDIIVIPYREIGQSGSGIASLSVQFGKRVLFSDTKSTMELANFLNRAPLLFDTNSDLSLTSGLRRVAAEDENTLRFHGYTYDTNIETYLSAVRCDNS